ncbi:RNase H domain-containing protein [Trichonephila clavipes]|nr:RNase H domain-containing protein [Trichonephila clavipes]
MILEKRENNSLTGNLILNGFSLDCVKELKYLGAVLERHTGIYGNERADWLAKEAVELSDLIPMSILKSYHKKVFREKIISEWNNLYQISNNAHLTKEFIPSIQSRLKAKHFHPNFKLTQFLTGHGNFKAYLKRFNLSPTLTSVLAPVTQSRMPSI